MRVPEAQKLLLHHLIQHILSALSTTQHQWHPTVWPNDPPVCAGKGYHSFVNMATPPLNPHWSLKILRVCVLDFYNAGLGILVVLCVYGSPLLAGGPNIVFTLTPGYPLPVSSSVYNFCFLHSAQP